MRYQPSRTKGPGSAIAAALAMCVAVLGSGSASAQVGASYIPAFTQNDTYRLDVFGDSLADGISDGLAGQFARNAEVRVVNKARDGTSLTSKNYERWLGFIEQTGRRTDFQIAVVMVGVYDHRSIRLKGVRYRIATPQWQSEYAKRVDRLIQVLKREKAAIYWVGLPVMRSGAANFAAQTINGIVRERAFRNGIKFIDTWNGFTDQAGQFTEYGPDLQGEMRRLRARDGVHFTGRGYRKLAQFVERAIRRDLALAKAERKLPLAGDADEQRRLRQRLERERKRLAKRAEAKARGKTGAKGDATAKAAAAKGDLGAIEYKADNSTIRLNVAGEGRKSVTIEIVRPAIPAAVVTHIRRRARSPRSGVFGRRMVVGIAGGETVLGSVATSDPSGSRNVRNQVPVTQTPYYKVLVKGEKLPSKPGRADDFPWPRNHHGPSG